MAASPASMLKVVSSGLEDLGRLNLPKGQPSLTPYRSVIRKRNRWASQWRRVDFDMLADFGRTATVTLPILGDLITRATLVVDLPDLVSSQRAAIEAGAVGPFWSWTNGVGHALCSDVQFKINDQILDRFNSQLLAALDEQHAPIEHIDSTNQLLLRNPSTYSATETQDPTASVEVVFPFWWNRGLGPQALPIQALYKDKVQITVSFRAAQDVVYTTGRAADGGLPPLSGATFVDSSGAPVPGVAMPTQWHFRDAYWIVEYISLEDREAAAIRMADLQIPFEQRILVPPQTTAGARYVRIPLEQAGLIRDMTWIAQRDDALTYNNYFLFSRDLGDPWWPNAVFPLWDYQDGYARPAFVDRRSDPIQSATLWIGGKRRFESDAPSFFRTLMPALNCRRTPSINRYVYRYDFGFWPSGGLAETLDLAVDEVRGAANWDKLPDKELALTMNVGCTTPTWAPDPSQPARTYTGATFQQLESDFAGTTQAFRVDLYGATPYLPPSEFGDQDVSGYTANGCGAYVSGIVDYQTLRRTPNFASVAVRTVPNGSASLVLQAIDPSTAASTYTWIAVAGGGGWGSGAGNGGDAGSAVQIGSRGDGVHSHDASGGYGGAGGGRPAAVGAPDGQLMPTNSVAFVTTFATTGTGNAGDGYAGGGSGFIGGGGGGSYVSRLISGVESYTLTDPAPVRAVVTPLIRADPPPPSYQIHVWLTRINMLRVSSGRAAVLFTV
jgi:hypothetical protein